MNEGKSLGKKSVQNEEEKMVLKTHWNWRRKKKRDMMMMMNFFQGRKKKRKRSNFFNLFCLSSFTSSYKRRKKKKIAVRERKMKKSFFITPSSYLELIFLKGPLLNNILVKTRPTLLPENICEYIIEES